MHKTGLAARLEAAKEPLPEDLRRPAVLALMQLSLAEDLSANANPEEIGPSPTTGDVTSTATLSPDARLTGRITAKAAGVVAGLPVAAAVFQFVDPQINLQYPIPNLALSKAEGIQYPISDGQSVEPGQIIATVSGPGAALLAAERTALNFLGRMSGIATLTRRYVEAVAGTRAVILDTRKTAPGSRHLDKYAVRMGGGSNHRLGLFDMALVKDNHIDGAGGIEPAVARIRERHGDTLPIEVEVKTLDELQLALRLSVDRIMLDNMDLDTMRAAVQRAAGRVPLEASGNVTLETVRAIAETGVDFISVGALTHSAPALDISLRLV